MEEKIFFNKDELSVKIKEAKLHIRVLGAVSFDLEYEKLRDECKWYDRIDEGKLKIEIICESESDLTYSSLISDNKKVSGQDRSYDIGHFMRIRNEPKIKLRDYFKKNNCRHIEPKGENPKRDEKGGNPIKEFNEKTKKDEIVYDKNEEQCFSLRTCYWRIPVPAINIDDDYYITFSLTKFCTQDKFEKITSKHLWYDEFHKYFHTYFDEELGAKKYSTEITEKDNRTEVILMYNDKRYCLGPLPRQSFMDISKAKVVIWGMVFTRKGKVVIHKRADNAKDNRGMWDKSIGGHVDWEKDTVDTVKAAAREMLEELYKIEAEDQGSHTASEIKEINSDIPIFLGEWREELRTTLPFKEMKDNKRGIYFFRMNYKFSEGVVDSPRILPGSDEKPSPVKCFADMYVFIMDEQFDETKLENSDFKLFELYELYDAYKGGEEIEYWDKKQKKNISGTFTPTPDLKRIMTTESLWAELTTFSEYLREGISKD